MDLTLDGTQRDLVGLAGEIFGDAAGRGTPDTELWATLASAGLLGVAVPEELGGLGLGPAELGLVLEQAGRVAATVPLLESLALAATAVREVGRDDQRRDLLAPLARGEAVLTAALTGSVGAPPTGSRSGPDGWVLSGACDWVPSAPSAAHLLVAAELAGLGPRLVVLGPGRAGSTVHPRTGSGGSFGRVELREVPVSTADVLGDPDDPRGVPTATAHATAGACSVVAGALGAVVGLIADYTRTREQFGRPIGSFQAVGQRAADAFTAAWSVELTARQACGALVDGRDGAREVAVAKYTAATAGERVIRAAHHLHGGIGMDRDYPLYRYTLLVKRMELLLGGASEQATLLGDLLAAGALAGAVG